MRSIVWFRNDLRIKDHQPLRSAAVNGGLFCVYVFDNRLFEKTRYGFPKTDAFRAQFIIESVSDLREQLRSRGADLIVRDGNPEEVIPALAKELNVDAIHLHAEATMEEIKAEEAIEEAVSIPLIRHYGHTLYHRDDLPFDLLTIPDVFTNFRKQVEAKCEVRKPLDIPEKLSMELSINPGELPTVQDLKLEEKPIDEKSVLQFKGGERESWKRLNSYFFEGDHLRNYKFTRNGLLGADYSSKLSPWLAQGCISARSVYDEVERYEKKVHKNVSTYWLKFELIWRDYFRYSAIKYGNQIFKLGGIQNKDLNKSTDSDLFNKWANSKTGIPFIDANMRELNQTGYMSNRGRQNTASFLAQNLNFDWRWGAAYFESKLIDYDVCSNWGNWAYNATVGHDPRNRYFNILNQANKYDKKGEYVRYWLPELKNVPKEFIHEPHKMTPDQQTLFEVIIGKDYPTPVIDLEESYKVIRERD